MLYVKKNITFILNKRKKDIESVIILPVLMDVTCNNYKNPSGAPPFTPVFFLFVLLKL